MPLQFYPGLFTPRRAIVDQKRKIVVEDRGALDHAKRVLTACQNLPELQERVLEIWFKNFSTAGKSLVYAGFWNRDKFIALTIPPDRPPLPKNASRYVKIGGEITYPLQPRLIQAAVESKEMVREGSKKEEFLAIPLVPADGDQIIGVLLLSNRLTQGRMPITDEDVEAARSFGEIAAEALAHFS